MGALAVRAGRRRDGRQSDCIGCRSRYSAVDRPCRHGPRKKEAGTIKRDGIDAPIGRIADKAREPPDRTPDGKAAAPCGRHRAGTGGSDGRIREKFENQVRPSSARDQSRCRWAAAFRTPRRGIRDMETEIKAHPDRKRRFLPEPPATK